MFHKRAYSKKIINNRQFVAKKIKKYTIIKTNNNNTHILNINSKQNISFRVNRLKDLLYMKNRIKIIKINRTNCRIFKFKKFGLEWFLEIWDLLMHLNALGLLLLPAYQMRSMLSIFDHVSLIGYR